MSSLAVNDVDFGEHGVIYITSDKERPLLTEWTKPATAKLLEVLTKEFTSFNRGRLPSKRRLFDNCGSFLKKNGYNYTSAQCENKWKSLKRRYLSTYEKLARGKRPKSGQQRQMFDDEIEAILTLEKPEFKKEVDEITKVNLNIPPGFHKKQEYVDMNEEEEEDDIFEDYEDTATHDYTQNDAKLVEMVLNDSHCPEEDESLKDNKSSVFVNNIEYLFSNPEDDTVGHSGGEKYNNTQSPQHTQNNDQLVHEVKELRKVVKRSLDSNITILKTHNATHEQILVCLDAQDKREEEKLELKKRKLEKQGELIQQIKIQNSLIAKLIQKLGNSNNTSINK